MPEKSSVLLAFSALAAVATAALGTAGPAKAMPPAAEKLYEDGKAALKAGDLDRALGRFRESLPLVAADERDVWQVLLAVALVWERKGELAHAFETYRRFLERSSEFATALDEKWKERRQLAETSVRDLAKKLERTHGFVTIVTEPPGAALLVDGRRAGAERDAAGPFGTYLPAGRALVRAEAPGRDAAETWVEVAAGKLHPVKLVLAPAASSPDPAELSEAEGPVLAVLAVPPEDEAAVFRSEPPPPSPRVAPWILAGAGAAALGTGVVFTLRALGARADLDRWNAGTDPAPTEAEWTETVDRKDTSQLLSFVFYGAGAALVAGGALWLTLAPTPDGPGVAAGGRF